MQTVRKLRKRSGFTLVELLIVIIIIGILAGAMLLVAGSGTDSAEATKIISGLRSMKAAALMYYADYPNDGTVPDVASLEPYMDGAIAGGYSTTETGSSWFVQYDLAGQNAATGVRRRLSESEAVMCSPDNDTATIAYMQAR
jgi:general secretion pathway protein G